MQHVDLIKGIIIPYANFFVFLLLAYFLMKKPFAAMVLGRRKSFEELLHKANQEKEEAMARAQKLEAKLNSLYDEVEKIKENAKLIGSKEADKIVLEAEELAKHLIEEAHRVAAAEVTRAKNELRAEIVQEVMKDVRKKIQQDLGEKTKLEIVHRQVEVLKNLTAHHIGQGV